MSRLKRRQQEILEFIEECQRLRGSSPSLREIGKRFGIASTNGVRYHLGVLEKAGKLERRRYTSRGIHLTGAPPPPPSAGVPLVGQVAAGALNAALEEVEREIDLDRELFGLGQEETLFGLRVQGDSMKDAGMLEGDIVIVSKGTAPRPGQIVVARLGTEATIKRFEKKADRIVLHPENPAYQPIEITADRVQGEDFEVLGVVVGLLRTQVR